MQFRRFIETDNKAEWQRLYEHCLSAHKGKGPFQPGSQFHENLVRLLTNVGLDEEANEINMIKPSEEDIEFGQRKGLYGVGAMTMGAVLNNKHLEKLKERFSAAHRAYYTHLEHIMDVVEQKAEQMGWTGGIWA